MIRNGRVEKECGKQLIQTELTEIGSKRSDTKIGNHFSKAWRRKPHEGFYSQEEMRDIIQYAKERYIEVIPEINMPGHSTAAIASYPFLSCTEVKLEVKKTFGIFKDIYCSRYFQYYY